MIKKKAYYGSWESPISADMVAHSGTGSSALPREIQVDNGSIYWVEQQPEQGGRYVIAVLSPGGSKTILTPSAYNVRSRVHEYGGGAYCIRNGTVSFINDSDQRIYRHDPGQSPYPITPATPEDYQHRYADGAYSPDGKWMLWVRERHESGAPSHNEIILIAADGSVAPRTIISGHDFYSNPRFNPEGNAISWLCWDHPRMPWDGTELWTAPFHHEADEIGKRTKVAGAKDISIFQPEWSLEGLLYFVSDQTGWWNIHRANSNGLTENICPLEAEFGYPQWLFGFTKYAFLSERLIIASYKIGGRAELGLINVDRKTLEPIPTSFTTFENPSIRTANEEQAWFFAGTPDHPPALCRFNLDTKSAERVLNLSGVEMDPAYISPPKQLEFSNRHGASSYAFYYEPLNPDFSPMPNDNPALIVMSHGGPTSSARPHLDLETQYWTSRGFAVVDVDYSGSVGYGRAYRERLNGHMGELDVQDCIDAARHLAAEGRVDPSKLIMRGSSAGGYVTLCALTYHDEFAAGGIYYGISDLEALLSHTHKFEAHYLDTLIGPYPEEATTYKQRSPIHHTDQLNCPMILLQGLKDKVVPPEQSQRMVKVLDSKSIPYVYLTFKNEGHGFDRSETIKRSLNAELYFYLRVLNIPLEAEVSPIKIHNLD